jgi:ribulose 1,5-bisphosphate synthetase/thiazole synthase
MSDPILEAHQILPRFFLLTAKGFSPISIRDQMVRAQWLVERAWTTGALSKGARVLVVGAGAAGATAAITAGQHRLDTTLIELTAHSFWEAGGLSDQMGGPDAI